MTTMTTTNATGYRLVMGWTGDADDGYDFGCYFTEDIFERVFETPKMALDAATASYKGADEFGVGVEVAVVPADFNGSKTLALLESGIDLDA